MRDAFEALAVVLREEAQALESLVVLAQTENEALVAMDHEALLASLGEQDAFVGSLARLDRERSTAAAALAAALGTPEEATLLELCQAMPEELAEEGRRLHDEIQQLAGQLAELNRENDVLIRQALHQTQHSIALLTGIARHEERKENYGPAPHGARLRGSSVLDRLV